MSDYQEEINKLISAIKEDVSINSYDEGYQQGFEDGKREALRWLPIEQAPKDGTTVYATGWDYGAKETRHYTFARWDENKWIDENFDPCAYLTHFMPLPQPPKEQE